MTADVRPAPAGTGGGGDHPDADHATLTTVIAGLATEVTNRTTADALAAQRAANLSDLANAGTARTNLGLGTAATANSTAFEVAGAAAAAQAAAIAASQPVDADLTAIAALTTTAYGRAFLALADAAAARTALALGTAATQNTGAFDAAGAAAAAQAASQPLDSDLTAIAALSTTALGRGLLALADAAAGRTALALGTAAVAATGDFDAAGAATAAAAASIAKSLVDAKGDIIAATANDTPARLAVGTDGHVLTADSAQSTGVKWAAAAGGGGLALTGLKPQVGEFFFMQGAYMSAYNFEDGRAIFAIEYVPPGTNIDGLACRVTSAGSAGAVVRMVMYQVAANGGIGALVKDAGTVDGTGTGHLTAGFTSMAVAEGWYWCAAINQGAPATRPSLSYAVAAAGFRVYPSSGIYSDQPYVPGREGTISGAAPDPGPSTTISPNPPSVFLRRGA